MTAWDTPGDPLADLESTRAQITEAIAATQARRSLELYDEMQRGDPLVAFIFRALAASERRGRRYRQHHPRPLPIDGHEYARRRRHR